MPENKGMADLQFCRRVSAIHMHALSPIPVYDSDHWSECRYSYWYFYYTHFILNFHHQPATRTARGTMRVTTEPLKVAKFSQSFSSVQPCIEWESVGILLRPLGNAAYASCLPLLCQGSKWLNDKSVGLVFRRSWVESQLDPRFFPREVYVQGTSIKVGMHLMPWITVRNCTRRVTQVKKLFDNLKEMANSRLEHKVTKFNNSLIKTNTQKSYF